jgi:hypothetical protein
LNAYARSLPVLGFDPAPGDVDLTRNLARQHFLVAQEARQVLALVERLNLSVLQGRAADALRVIQGTFPPALRNTASAAESLQAATSSWADQLSGFQAEADALERQAAAATAQQQALAARQAALPPGSLVLTGDLQAASATVSGIHGQAQELHQRYLAAAGKTAVGVEDHSGLWDGTEPVREVLEFVLAPLDIVAADHWIDALKEVAGQPSDWLKEVDNSLIVIRRLQTAGQPRVNEIQEAADLIQATGAKEDAWATFAPGWLKTAAGSIAEIRGLSAALTGLGVIADAGTIISPQDTGVLGGADRATAAVNGALLVLNATTDWVPGWGEAVIAVTGAYLAGDFLFHHRALLGHVADDVGHAVVTSVEQTVDSNVATAEEAGHLATSAWHSVTSSIGSWF